MRTTYDVAIILINYNSTDYTRGCIESVIQHTDPKLKWQIVVVDNASSEQSYTALKDYVQGKENIILVRSILNVGFSGGNMMGVQQANADYIYFLNNDTTFLNDNLSILYSFMQSHPDAALCSGQMFNGEQKPIRTFTYFPTVGVKLLGPGVLRLFNPAGYPKRDTTYEQPMRVPLVSGASMFVRFSMLSAVGGMDTNYFFYCEEEDLAYTLRKRGWFCYLVPEARFIHYVGSSTTVKKDFLQEYYFSLIYFFSKHYSWFSYTILKWWFFFKLLKKFYKGGFYAKIAWMIARNAPPHYSLRFRQQILRP
jgi:GT2 family glycosyltransferase